MAHEIDKLVKVLDGSGLAMVFVDRNNITHQIKAGTLFSDIIAAVEGRDPQESVKDKDLSIPPTSPAVKDRYIVGPASTGLWAGKAEQIAEWHGTEWAFTVPTEGMYTFVEDENAQYTFDGLDWIKTFTLAGIHEHVYNVVPTGLVNGTNAAFTLPTAPNPAESLMLHKNGMLMRQGVGNDFVLAGTAVTFQSGQIPQVGDVMLASYSTLP